MLCGRHGGRQLGHVFDPRLRASYSRPRCRRAFRAVGKVVSERFLTPPLTLPLALDAARQRVLPTAPAGAHTVGTLVQDSFNLPEFSLLDFEKLRDLPGERACRAARQRGAAGSGLG